MTTQWIAKDIDYNIETDIAKHVLLVVALSAASGRLGRILSTHWGVWEIRDAGGTSGGTEA